jgi:hypothetical protein
MTAGFAQKLVNIEGYLPGKEIVILGSGDIGLIMARRLTWEGARVRAVVEILPYPGGLLRNVVQCLEDFDIPLYLSHTISEIHGHNRITEVDICPVDPAYAPDTAKKFTVPCDTLLLSVGLIPENELTRQAGAALHPVTRGPVVDHRLMTSANGIFACGNVLHVHDIVDFVSDEGERCGAAVAAWLETGTADAGKPDTVPVRAGLNVRYALPAAAERAGGTILCLRAMTPGKDATLLVQAGTTVLLRRKLATVHPNTMLRYNLPAIVDDAEFVEVHIHLEGDQP